MSGNQHHPDPFSREGAQPGDGLGEPNRFDTWADGATPAGQHLPGSAASDAEPPYGQPSAADPYGQPSAADPYGQPSAADTYGSAQSQPSAADTGGAFPAYPYGSGSTGDGYSNPSTTDHYANPQVDEAYAAFQGYQASTSNYPAQQVTPYQGYQAAYTAHSPYARSLPNSGYAIPSLVLGIVSFVTCGITGPLGIGFGVAALKQIQSEPNSYGGNGLAIGGIITGALGTLFLLMWIMGALMS